jgi:diacylglycerol kinase family enzyme
MARTLDLCVADGIVVVGGDGTINEVLNGMLARVDGMKLPIGLIPQGTVLSSC